MLEAYSSQYSSQYRASKSGDWEAYWMAPVTIDFTMISRQGYPTITELVVILKALKELYYCVLYI